VTGPLPLSEADFQQRVMDAARRAGWRVAHFRAAKTQRGNWITPMTGDKGFPDLALAKDGRVILAELKSDKGKPSKEQLAWLAAVGGHGRLWSPENWEAILLDLGVTKRAPMSVEERQERALGDARDVEREVDRG
jgi:hypothetical protein